MRYLTPIFASVFAAATVAAVMSLDATAQQSAAAGHHWPGKGLFGKGAVHTSTTPRYTVYAQRRDKPGAIEVHDEDTDIILFMDGSATFVTGGTVVGRRQLRPHEWTGTDVENAVTTKVSRGDVVIVPKGTVHWFKDVAGSVSYYAVKVHEPSAAPFEPAGARIWTRQQAFTAKSPFYDGKQAHRYQIFAVQRDKPGIPEVHEKDTDLVFVLDGAGTWMVGGSPAAGGGSLTGSTPWALASDDAALVPAGVHHWFRDARQLAYYAVKVY
jgi:mannose-6-phosphate isomerase-like protein (cupin superfamily)